MKELLSQLRDQVLGTKMDSEEKCMQEVDQTIKRITEISGLDEPALVKIFEELGIPYQKYNKFSHLHV